MVNSLEAIAAERITLSFRLGFGWAERSRSWGKMHKPREYERERERNDRAELEL